MKNKKMAAVKKLTAGIGSPLVDILIKADDDFLNGLGKAKGGMHYVGNDFIDQIVSRFSDQCSIVPGGSACNTIVGIGKLGGATRFVGKCGNGDMGKFFKSGLRDNNVNPLMFSSASPTGKVLSVVTPDAQRTMFTYLGAASEVTPDDITEDCFKDAGVVHIEGYLLFNRELMLKILSAAKSSGALISLDLSSFTVVEAAMDILAELVQEYVDILIANEDEAEAFTGSRDELEAVNALSKHAEIAVLKVGERGSYISHNGKVIHVKPGGTGSITDTTGAGDLWASGFLYGIVNGYSLKMAGELGSICGYEVCRVLGASIPDNRWANIRKFAG